MAPCLDFCGVYCGHGVAQVLAGHTLWHDARRTLDMYIEDLDCIPPYLRHWAKVIGSVQAQ